METIRLNPEDIIIPKVVAKQYEEYEYQANISNATVFFNDSSLYYNHLVMLQSGDNKIRFSLQGAAPESTEFTDTTVKYLNAYKDTDILYTVMNNKLKEDIMIKSSNAPHSFTFDLTEMEVSASFNEDGSFGYLDASGNKVWTIEAPYVYDAAGNEYDVAVIYDSKSYTYEILDYENAVYPITLDPTVSIPYNASLTSVTSTKYTQVSKLYKFYLTPSDAQDASCLYSVSFNYTNSYNSSYGGITGYTFYDKNNAIIGSTVSSYTANTQIIVPSNACYISVNFWANCYYSSTYYASSTTLYLSTVYIDTDKTAYYKKDLLTVAATKTNPNIVTPTLNFLLPGSASNDNHVIQVFKAAPGFTFVSGSLTYTIQLYGNYSNTYTANMKYYNEDGTLLSTITVAKPTGTTLLTRTITVPANAVTMVFEANGKCSTSAGTSVGHDFTNVTKTSGTVPGFGYYSFTPSVSGSYRAGAAMLLTDMYGEPTGMYVPTVASKTYYLDANYQWVEEIDHNFVSETPVNMIYMYGNSSQGTSVWHGLFIYKGVAAPTSEYILFGLSETIFDGGSATLSLNESSIESGSNTFSLNETIQGIDYSTLTIKDTIQAQDVLTLPLNELISDIGSDILSFTENIQEQLNGYVTILLPENIQDTSSENLSFSEMIQVSDYGTLSIKDIIQAQDVNTMPLIEYVYGIDVYTHPLKENIEGITSNTLSLTQNIMAQDVNVFDLITTVQAQDYSVFDLTSNIQALDINDLNLSETISAIDSALINLTEDITGANIEALPLSINVYGQDVSILPLNLNIQESGIDTFTLNEDIFGSDASSLSLSEDIYGSDNNLLQINTIVQANESVLLPMNLSVIQNDFTGLNLSEVIQQGGINTLPINELAVINDSVELVLNELIQNSGSAAISLKESVTMPADKNILQLFDKVIVPDMSSLSITDNVYVSGYRTLNIPERVVIESGNKNIQNHVNIIERVMSPNINLIENILTDPNQTVRLTPKYAVRMKGRRYS